MYTLAGRGQDIMKLAIPLFCVLIFYTSALSAELPKKAVHHNNTRTVNNAFVSGEKMTYSVSWSKILQAGIAVMEVRNGETVRDRKTLQLISRTHSVGMVDVVYPVRDMVESIVDADDLRSIAFTLKESHGTRKRAREMTFDRENSTVRVIINNGVPETHTVPERVLDALSSLYYVRTRQDFIVGKPIIVDVHDSGKTWAIEVHTLGRETITTPAGEFKTIMVKTYPKYEGVFMHKGEIFIWITDDDRKLPVLMKSKISIGSIIATLIEIQDGK